MKIKLDENLPGRLVALLEDLGHDVDTVPMEEIAGRSDDVVWGAARSEGRFLITQDSIFLMCGNLRREPMMESWSSAFGNPAATLWLPAYSTSSNPR